MSPEKLALPRPPRGAPLASSLAGFFRETGGQWGPHPSWPQGNQLLGGAHGTTKFSPQPNGFNFRLMFRKVPDLGRDDSRKVSGFAVAPLSWLCV